MTESGHSFVDTPENFAELVLGNSARGPVLFNLKADEHQGLVRERDINRVPTPRLHFERLDSSAEPVNTALTQESA